MEGPIDFRWVLFMVGSIKMGSIYLFSLSRPFGTQFGYILIITALRLTACTVLLMVTPLRGDL